MPREDYTDEQLRQVTPEQLSQVKIRDPNLFKVFNLKDPRNPGLISQVSTDRTTINPGLEGLRGEGATLAGESLQNLRADRENLIGDPSTFVERRTDPLRQTITQESQALDKRLTQTAITGEFAQQSRETFQANAQQKLASGEQLAMDELASFQGNYDSVEGGLLRLMENIDFTKFTQDAQARGMSQDLKNQLVRLDQGRIGVDAQQDAARNQNIGNALNLLSQLFGGD